MHVLYNIWLVGANITALAGLVTIEYGALGGIFMLKEAIWRLFSR